MKLGYYPGCTLKTKAANLEVAAMAALDTLGVEYRELSRWNCCGAVFSLADDDLIHQVAPVRNLIRAAQEGCDTVVTLCSQCYNTLARANQLVRDDEEKRDTLNRFMDEEPDYNGEVEVVHYLSLLHDEVGWEKLAEAVTKPLDGLRVAPFYGCTLVRPQEVAVDAVDPEILEGFVKALGAEPTTFSASRECCGSYQMMAHPEEGRNRAAKVIASANRSEADALILSCPLCEYNLGTRQSEVLKPCECAHSVPTFYFTQLLALAMGIESEDCHFELCSPSAREFLDSRQLVTGAS